tara:strand:+ start:94 stop:1002 length:909 start_codon:yes stop_codon:yes gene_type:complete
MTPPLPMTPQPASNVVGAGTWVSGTGNTQTSGTPTGYAEYKQWLTIEYSRVPGQANGPDADPFRSLGTLSATATKDVHVSHLHCNITAHNSCTFVSGNYNASAFYQPQKFQLNAVGYDSQGNTGYGDLTGSANSYIFGPQGSITTTQPYIDRHVKGVNDIEYNITTKGTTHYLKYDFDNSYLAGGDLGQDFGNHMNRRNGQDCLPYDPSGRPTARAYAAGDAFAIYGGSYSVSSEPGHQNNANGLARMIVFIEGSCSDLSVVEPWFRYFVNMPISSEGFERPVDSDHVDINPYYQTNRHDYS